MEPLVKSILEEVKVELFEGGGGSGNWGHKGIPGHRGGSLPTKAGSIFRHMVKSQSGSLRIPGWKRSRGLHIPKVSGKLFRAARKARNLEVILSGNPWKMLKRLINIYIGRKFAGRFYR